jgi:hypothetical protein
MIRRDPRGRGEFPCRMVAQQLSGLTLELLEVGTQEEGTCWHDRSLLS